MSRERTPTNLHKGIEISGKTRKAYKALDRSREDPEAPVLPPERWSQAMRRGILSTD
jgi:hypothetical protein